MSKGIKKISLIGERAVDKANYLLLTPKLRRLRKHKGEHNTISELGYGCLAIGCCAVIYAIMKTISTSGGNSISAKLTNLMQ